MTDSKTLNPFRWLRQVEDPVTGDIVPGFVTLTRLRKLVIKNYFDEHFLVDLVHHNRQSLQTLTLRRESVAAEIYLSETPYLQEINLWLNRNEAVIHLGSAAALEKITANCRLVLTEHMPSLSTVTYNDGYRPSADESKTILSHGVKLNVLCLRDIEPITGPTLQTDKEPEAILN